MINKREFFKTIKNNRVLVFAISVIVITGVYYGVDKAIDSYVFYSNSDIIEADGGDDEESEDGENATGEELGADGASDGQASSNGDNGDGAGESSGETSALKGNGEDGTGSDENGSGKVPEDEVNFELGEDGEGIEDMENTEVNSEADEKIYVYITGEVNIPGVVILNKGSRIVDAINAAGGTTVKANISKVNLVYVLEDGMKVNIPNSNDLKNNSDFEYITMSSGDGASDIISKNDAVSGETGAGSTSGRDYGIVNINTATQTELETLPGIGPSLALKIINYRKDNGKFSSIDEIKNVSGIGESKFENMKGYITV